MSTLETPILLIAMPQVLDPFFHRSVVLLVHHGDEGSFGFIVNRTTGIRVPEILAGMEIGWNGPPVGAPGFRSQMSIVAGPPPIHSKIADL